MNNDSRRVKRSLRVLRIRAFWSVFVDVVPNLVTMHSVARTGKTTKNYQTARMHKTVRSFFLHVAFTIYGSWRGKENDQFVQPRTLKFLSARCIMIVKYLIALFAFANSVDPDQPTLPNMPFFSCSHDLFVVLKTIVWYNSLFGSAGWCMFTLFALCCKGIFSVK